MIPVVAFFNNKGRVGKTTLVYHLAWMTAEMGVPVLAADLDPQAHLTTVPLDEDRVEKLWGNDQRRTVYGALSPLLEGVGDVEAPHIEEIGENLNLAPGDLLLSGAERELSTQWPRVLDGEARALRVEAAFAQVVRFATEAVAPRVVLVDVDPNLGAINRAAMVASDRVMVPPAPDLYSLQGLRNLGPILVRWREGWNERKKKRNCSGPYAPEATGGSRSHGSA